MERESKKDPHKGKLADSFTLFNPQKKQTTLRRYLSVKQNGIILIERNALKLEAT